MPPVTFLQLPREIRDRIYDFVFTWEEIYPACIGENRRYTFPGNPIRIPPLLLVNHQISSEAAVSYYGDRVWVGRPPDLVLFLGQNESYRTLIKAVKISATSEFNNEAWLPQLFSSLSSLSDLRSVTLVMSSNNLTAAQTKLARMGLDLLKGQVELIIDNRSLDTEYLDEALKLFIREGIGRRAADAMDWVNEEEKVTYIT